MIQLLLMTLIDTTNFGQTKLLNNTIFSEIFIPEFRDKNTRKNNNRLTINPLK